MISILYKMGENIVVILHIYGDRAISLLFYDEKDTLSTYFEIGMRIPKLIFKHKNISIIYGTTISILYKMGETYCDNYSHLWNYIYISTIL